MQLAVICKPSCRRTYILYGVGQHLHLEKIENLQSHVARNWISGGEIQAGICDIRIRRA